MIPKETTTKVVPLTVPQMWRNRLASTNYQKVSEKSMQEWQEYVKKVAMSIELPTDAKDVTDLASAKAEIARYRAVALKYNKQVVPDLSNFPWDCLGLNNKVYDALKPSDYLKAVKFVGPRGYTFDQAIQCCTVAKRGRGMAIPDEESYYLWQDWYDKIINVLHKHPVGAEHVTNINYEEINTAKLPADLENYCVSVIVSISRNVSGFGLSPAITREERRDVEKLVKSALRKLKNKLHGDYFSFCRLNQEQTARLEGNPLLAPYLKAPAQDTSIAHSGGARDWPEARGLFLTKDKSLVILVNREDHIRFKSIKVNIATAIAITIITVTVILTIFIIYYHLGIHTVLSVS